MLLDQTNGLTPDDPTPRPCHAGDMCRNIRVLHNFDPPATDQEIQAAALQYVRKVSGTTRPSAANQQAFDAAVAAVADATRTLLDSLVTKAPPGTGRWRRPRPGRARRTGTAVPRPGTAPTRPHSASRSANTAVCATIGSCVEVSKVTGPARLHSRSWARASAGGPSASSAR